MIFRVIDIETIPDPEVWTPGEATYKIVPDVRTTANYDTGPISTERISTSEKILRAVEIKPFFPPHAQRVVAISGVDVVFDPASSPKYRFDKCFTTCGWSRETKGADYEERKLLADFHWIMSGDVHFVTWNGRTFDLPVIVLRSLKHGLPCKWYYANKDVRYRYSPEGHLDLMDYWSDFGAVRPMKLHDACRLIGLPGKTDMSGASIEGIYQSSLADLSIDLEKTQTSVARYCLQDSIQTALLWVRSRYHVGKVDVNTHNAILDTFSSSESIRDAISLDWDRLKL